MVTARLAVVGLGLMGSRMARRLALNGFELRGFDPSPDRMDEFASMGGQPVDSPGNAVAGCDAALLSLPDSDVSREVCLEIAERGDLVVMVGGPRDAYEWASRSTRPSDDPITIWAGSAPGRG